MSGGSEGWAELLAERVKALAEPRNATSSPGHPPVATPPDLAEARRFLDFAFTRKEPSVAGGSRLEGAKRLVLRGARIFTRSQTEYNAALVEVLERVLAELSTLGWARVDSASRIEEGRVELLRLESVLGDRAAGVERSVGDLAERSERLAGRIDDLLAALEAERRSREELGAEARAIGKALEREQSARGEISLSVARIEAALLSEQSARERLAGQAASIEGALASEQQARSELAEQIGRVENALASEQSGRDELTRQVASIEGALASEQQARSELAGQLDRMEGALAAEQSERSRVAGQASAIEGALADEQRARDELSKSVGALAERLDRIERPGRSPEELWREVERLRASLALERARGAAATPAAAAGPPPPTGASAPLLPDFAYFDFEDRFRGPEGEIAARQEVYVPFLREVSERTGGRLPVLDAGCGRGELLELLGRAGIRSEGVDSNGAMVARCREKGLAVREGDLFGDLDARPDGSLAAVVAAQVVEHLPVEALVRLLRLARRKVAPGGGLLLETINPESLYAMRWFWHDPTHVRPVPAPTLEMLARAAGFAEAEIRWLSPVEAAIRLDPAGDPNLEKIDRALFGHQDYALLARAVE
jgi:O-antigen chain-terminating methyltransferase